MSIPAYFQFARPVLEALATDAASRGDLYERMAVWANLTAAERAEAIQSGQETYKNRVGWALTWLRLGGLVANPGRGLWAITPAGVARLGNLESFTSGELKRLWNGTPASDEPKDAGPPDSLTPEERISAATSELHRALRQQILLRLKAGSPTFFEVAVLKLLKAMGYGRFERTGGTDDHGIDGVLYLDRLGLERVYVQAKRWENDVPRDRLQAFSGAMDEHHATKGVIVTWGAFATSAKKYVPGGSKIIRLVDGDELGRLMIEHGVGVSVYEHVEIKRIDEDFFEE